jgi:hypothetical protein
MSDSTLFRIVTFRALPIPGPPEEAGHPGAGYHRLLLPVPGRPLTTAFAAALVRNLMDGIRPREASTTSKEQEGIA